jgi:tetratricopeptide (TPR) repeat protein
MLLIAFPVFADWTDQYRSGEDLLQQGQLKRAIRELQLARAQCPNHPAILDALGRAEFQTGNYRLAKKYFAEATQIAGGDSAAGLVNLAMANIALSESRRAESLAQHALEREPGNVKVLKILAQALYLQKRHAEAKGILQRILAIQSDPITRADLATIYEAEHKIGVAMDLLQEALTEITPGQARARMRTNLAMLQWQSGMSDLSEKTLRQALAEVEASVGSDHADTARVLELYGKVLRRIGRKAEARNATQRAAAIRAATAFQTNENGFTIDWRDTRER